MRRRHGGAVTASTVAVAACLALLAVAAARERAREGVAGDVALAAQAADPEPIVVEMLTDRAEFPDDVAMTLAVALQGSSRLDLEVPEPSRTAVARITVQPGATFPWHTHPGPILVNVAEGELVYVPASDCSEHPYAAGTAFWDPGRGNVHTAYNPGGDVTVLIATFFEAPAEGPLTITEGVVAPEGCQVGPGAATGR